MIFKKILQRIDALETQLRISSKVKDIEPIQSIDVLRHSLACIDVSDIDVSIDAMEEGERKKFASDISVARNTIKILIQYFLEQQKEFALQNAESMEQIWMSRGTINGLYLIDEKIDQFTAEDLQNKQDEKEKGRSEGNTSPSQSGL